MEHKKRAEALLLLYLLFLFFLILIHRAILFRCGGHLFYSYDDAYIHMAMAKNLVRHGVLGITRFAYTPASSSPLWTLLLGFGYLLFGVNTYIPLVLNLVFLVILVWQVWKTFEGHSLSWQFTLSFLFLLALPVYLILYSGMEHILHILLVLLLARKFVAYLHGKKLGWDFYLLVFLAMGARYETSFFLLLFFLYFLWERKWAQAGTLLASAVPFPLAYGIMNIYHGWGFLPSSVAVKGKSVILHYLLKGEIFGAIRSFLGALRFRMTSFAVPTLSMEIFIFFLLAAFLLVLFLQGKEKWPFYLFPPILITLHFLFAYYTYPPRYQNYLLAFALPFVLKVLQGVKVRNRLAPFLLGAVALGFFTPRFLMNYNTPVGSEGLYSQQYQMAMFVKRFFPRGRVVLNDIGTVAFYNEGVKIVDFVGLATREVYEIKISPVPSEDRRALIKNFLSRQEPDLAIAFEDWIKPILPEGWWEAGRWRLLRNLVSARREVVFYGVKDRELPLKLRFNSVFLPDVVEGGGYTLMKGWISRGNYRLWEPGVSIVLKPGGKFKIPLSLPHGKYRLFVRARGAGAVLKLLPPGESVELDKFSFHPYMFDLYLQGEDIFLENPSSRSLVFRELLFQGPGEDSVNVSKVVVQGE